MEEKTETTLEPCFFYNDFQELVTEWQKSEVDCSIWEYLGMPEFVFRDWLTRNRAGVFDT
jgi:hypothetical protein